MPVWPEKAPAAEDNEGKKKTRGTVRMEVPHEAERIIKSAVLKVDKKEGVRVRTRTALGDDVDTQREEREKVNGKKVWEMRNKIEEKLGNGKSAIRTSCELCRNKRGEKMLYVLRLSSTPEYTTDVDRILRYLIDFSLERFAYSIEHAISIHGCKTPAFCFFCLVVSSSSSS